MQEQEVIFRVHAAQQMSIRGISETDVRPVLEDGEVIEEYPDDLPFPAQLILGWVRFGRARLPMHVVASFDGESNTIYVVTVYQPTPSGWRPGFRIRKKKA